MNKKSKRALGLNPRALMNNPRALGVAPRDLRVNPRALGVSPAQVSLMSAEKLAERKVEILAAFA